MKDETIVELKATAQALVTQQVKKGGGVRWGEAESVAVIAGMVDWLVATPDATAEGSDAIAGVLREVVNPSSFAQKLEKLPEGNPRRIVRAARGVRSAAGGLDL